MTLGSKVALFGGGILVASVALAGLLGASSGLLWVGAGGVLLLWIAGSFASRDLAAHGEILAQHIRELSRGNLAERPAPETYPPELGVLDGALRDLADEVGGRISELERERDELQSLIESIAEGVMALTPDARVLRMNSAAAELLEASPPTLFAPVGALVRHPELRDHLEASVVGSLPSREVLVGERHLVVSSRLLPGGGSVVTFLDVTGLRRMEQVRRDFVANASHELKTPLTAVRGFAETLLEGDPPENLKREFLTSIRNNTLRLQNLVDNLLDLSRLESGGWNADEEEVPVSEAAEEAWVQVVAERPGRNLRFSVEGGAIALADRQALHQIFRNLMENAVRYTPDGGSVTVSISRGTRDVRVAVADTGAGISSSALPRIFERFYRADPGRDRKEGGTGLGLAIVRHLVQSMGGEVRAESRLGAGTTILFTLRPADGDPPAEGNSAQEPPIRPEPFRRFEV